MNYLIPGLLLLITCISGYADQRNQSNVKVTKSSPQTSADTATSTSDELANVPVEKVNDPFERLNRSTFRLNDTFTTHVAKPVARTYEHIVPQKLRTAISNFFYNLDFPVRFSNDVLQGRIKRSGQEVSMFIINTTAGVAGFIRVSDHVPTLVDVPPEDFGLTLARWGFSAGPYLVVPVLGPSDIRDVAGLGGDFALNPLNWYQLGVFGHTLPTWANYTIGGARVMSGLPGGVRTYEEMKETAIDPYIAVRNAYLSHRAAQLQK